MRIKKSLLALVSPFFPLFFRSERLFKQMADLVVSDGYQVK